MPGCAPPRVSIWLKSGSRRQNGGTSIRPTNTSRIEEFPESYPLYRSRHGIFRKAPGGEHLIFYLVTKQLIDIVRITHNRSDYEEGLE